MCEIIEDDSLNFFFMYQGTYIFAQIVDVVSRYQCMQCVDRYHGAHRVKQLTCLEQFLALTFGQLSGRTSLRDIVMCLTAHHKKLSRQDA